MIEVKVYCANCSKVIREVPDDQATDQEIATLDTPTDEPAEPRKRELCDTCKKR